MAETHTITTSIEGNIAHHIRFSGEIPSYTLIAAAPVERLNPDENIIKLQRELGQSAVTITQQEAEIVELQTRISYLEAEQRVDLSKVDWTPQPREAVTHDTVGPISELCQNGNGHQNVNPGINNAKVSSIESQMPSGEIQTATELTTVQRRCEKILLYLIECPGFEVRRPNAGKFIKDQLGITKSSEWSIPKKKLEELGLISAEKVSPQARQSSAIKLNIEQLIKLSASPLVTQRVAESLRAYQQNLQKSETVAGSSNVNGHSIPGTPRLRNIIDQEQISVSTESPARAADGKGPDHDAFLASRR